MRKGILLFLWLAVLSGLWAQELSSGDTQKSQAEQDMLMLIELLSNLKISNRSTGEQLQILKQLLNSSEEKLNISEETLQRLRDLLETQGGYVNQLLEQADQRKKLLTQQSKLLHKYIVRSRVLTVSLVIAIPACMGVGMYLGYRLAR